MIIEQWTRTFERQWEQCIRAPLTPETVNQLLHESARIQGTGMMRRPDEKHFKLLSIFVHFGMGVIFRVDEMDGTAVALIHRNGRHRIERARPGTERTSA